MVACPRMVPSFSLLALLACRDLDKVPVVAGERCAPERDEVEVACTLDGDTFQVDACGGESVRMLGVDAAEIAHNDTEVDQCWGPEAADWLAETLEDAEVRLTFDATCQDTYERTLAYVWLEDDDGDERLVNEWIIRQGMAQVYEDFDDIRLAELLYAAQDAAQAEGLGRWGACE